MGLAVVIAACTTAPSAEPPVVNVSTGEQTTGISVTGSGEVTGTPDTLTVDLGVSVLGDTVSEAAATAAGHAEAVIAALTDGGVDRADITTTNYTISPEYDWRGNEQRLLGYRVMNTVQATIRDIAAAGSILDGAVAAGGDATQVHGIVFEIEEDSEMLVNAREAAWNDALAKARQLADLSGQTLGLAVSITETVSTPPIIWDRALVAEDTGTPIEPGTSAVTVVLQVQFALGA
ncbi:MAG: SIMPL domain-containing protein [Actinobacteria bacterium]|nr:SIMPL domain-containing protein [Actinomycetota bacterium]MCI0545013.1 SIMPL domain-containing protein [Actinomycetota bacterium]